MLIMYRRIYKEALRQKEAIRRSSVPSQQHLIVDSDSVRSRFQTLQANGFRSSTSSSSTKKLTPAPPPIMAPPTPHNAPPPNQSSPPIIMTSSESADGLKKIEEQETKFCEMTKEGGEVKPATPTGGVALTGSPINQTGSSAVQTGSSAAGSPVRNTLTPTTTLLGTVQRRLSFANSNLTEGRIFSDFRHFLLKRFFSTLFQGDLDIEFLIKTLSHLTKRISCFSRFLF